MKKDVETHMKLTLAKDFDAVKAGYFDVIARTPDIGRHARWVYGLHPSDELLQAYIASGEMYAYMDGGVLAGLAAIVMHQDQDYEAISWAESLAGDQVATLHLFAVCPDYQGKGVGGNMLEAALEIAKKKEKKALRLDALKSNLPARRMYEKAGFSYRGTQVLFAGNTGWVDFMYYEKMI